MDEIWKDVKGYEGLYQVSNLGRIKSLDRHFIRSNNKSFTYKGKILKGSLDTKGYIQIELKGNGQRDIRALHRLIAIAFIPNPENKPQIDHLDGNKTNNKVTNLEWVTCRENIRRAWRNGLNKPTFGERHGNAKLTDEQAMFIKTHYKRNDKEFGCKAFMKKYNISQTPIYNILRKKGWKHLDDNN